MLVNFNTAKYLLIGLIFTCSANAADDVQENPVDTKLEQQNDQEFVLMPELNDPAEDHVFA